jgi:hypothetical protein
VRQFTAEAEIRVDHHTGAVSSRLVLPGTLPRNALNSERSQGRHQLALDYLAA